MNMTEDKSEHAVLLARFEQEDDVYLNQFAAVYGLVGERLQMPRLLHSLGVAQTAAGLAVAFGGDAAKAYLAGLCHDIAKELPREQQLALVKRSKLAQDEGVLAHKVLWHAPAGSVLLADLAAVHSELDDAVQNACLWHTLGKPAMTRLEEIVFIADLIEPGRDFPDLPAIRQAAAQSLTAGVAACMYGAIHFLEMEGRYIHPLAYEGYNYYKNKLSECN